MSSKVEGLSYVPGLTSWQCTSKEGDLYSTWLEVPENLQKTVIRPEHFPTEDQEVLQQLKKCVRVLPHLQNTGGFFVALLEKVEALPWESKREKVFEETEKKEEVEKKEEPPTKKKRFWGFKEDPFVYCKEGDEAVSSCQPTTLRLFSTELNFVLLVSNKTMQLRWQRSLLTTILILKFRTRTS